MQASLVLQIRDLGLQPGGFYTPTYAGGGQLHLKMMCLGLHWEPRLHSYEETRSVHDGAKPPPMLPDVVNLTAVSSGWAGQDGQGDQGYNCRLPKP